MVRTTQRRFSSWRCPVWSRTSKLSSQMMPPIVRAWIAGEHAWTDAAIRMQSPRPPGAMRALGDAYQEGKLSIDELRKREVETAMADSVCYRSTGIGESLAAARERAEQIVLARSQDKAQALRYSLDNAIVRAKGLL